MAVKVHEFFKHFKHETVAFLMMVQILCGILAATVAWVLWQVFAIEPLMAFQLSVVALIIFNLLLVPLTLNVLSAPLKVITQAIAHVSKDPVVTTPPDVSAKHFKKSGLTDIVQTIYELAIAAHSDNKSGETTDGAMLASHILNTLPSGVIAINKTNAILYHNQIAPVSEAPDGTKHIDLLFEQNDDFAKWLADCRANKVRDSHTWLRVANKLPGEEGQRIFDVAGYYQKDENADIEVLLVAFDRTDAYAPDQEDMDFIAMAAHELRAPITVIRGYLDVLNQELHPNLSADQQALLDRLQVSSERLSGYVNNILNVSRYDRDQFKVHMHEEQLIEIIKTLIPDIALRAKTQNRSLVFHIAPDLPPIAADRSSVAEVITNLIDNAIKYSHQGGEVTVSASLKGNFIEVTVQDKGIGMPGNIVGNLFSRFYRSHRSRQTVGGTGLGLYICKAIIEAHGGSVWVRSKEGEGSTFGFTLPTYASVADKLQNRDNENDITQRPEGWIKNHAMYRR